MTPAERKAKQRSTMNKEGTERQKAADKARLSTPQNQAADRARKSTQANQAATRARMSTQENQDATRVKMSTQKNQAADRTRKSRPGAQSADRARKSAKRHPTIMKYQDGLSAQEVLEGSHEVQALSDTENRIGTMKHIVCPHCKAFKFKGETSRSCCLDRKVKLPLFPTPSEEMMDLLSPVDPSNLKSRLYRQNIRSFFYVFIS